MHSSQIVFGKEPGFQTGTMYKDTFTDKHSSSVSLVSFSKSYPLIPYPPLREQISLYVDIMQFSRGLPNKKLFGFS